MSGPFKWSLRSIKNFEGVHPDLVAVTDLALKNSPYDFIITDGVRTLDEQKQHVATGASKTMNSRHLPQEDGYGHAVDFAPLIMGKVRWEMDYCRAIADAFKKAGATLGVPIEWGGDWTKFKDGPHIQLSPKAYAGPFKSLIKKGRGI